MNIFRNSGCFFIATITLIVIIKECSSVEVMTKMQTVKDRILKGYDKLVRPTQGNSNTTKVLVSFFPRYIIDLDESKGIFTLDSFILMTWTDPRLVWEKAEYGGELAFPENIIWLPDISVYNSHSSSINPQSQTLLKVNSKGNVVWFPPILTETTCDAAQEATYPYDKVICQIIIGSWAHDGWSISWDKVHFDNSHFENIHQRWELLEDEMNFTHHVLNSFNDVYHDITLSFPLRRRPLPELEATRMPCIMVMLLTLSVFWLPTNSSKKVLVLGFQFLVLTVLIVYVAWSTKSPTDVVLATSFLRSTLYITVVTFLLQVLVILNVCNFSGPARPPPLAMQLLMGPCGKYACLRWSLNNDQPLDRVQLNEDPLATSNSPTPRDDWMLFAAGLDRLFFVLVSISMIAIHHL